MRIIARASQALAALALALGGGCSVADKHPDQPDAGPGDGGGPVDTQAPDTRIDQAPDAFSSSGQAAFRFSSDEPSATFECRIDDEQAAQPCQSPYVRTLSDGPHSFSVRAVDPAGNGDDTPAERVWTIDTVAPDTMLMTGPPAADNSVTAQFTFQSSEDNVGFDCSIDNAGYQPCTTGQSFALTGDGPHSFAVRARDRAGNLDPSPAIYAWTVDTRTPDTQIVDGPPAASPSTGAAFSFVSPDAGAGATFQCSLDGAAFVACSSPQSYSGLREAAHSFAVRVRDAVGNLDPTPATRSWTVDLTPPDTAISAGPTSTVPVPIASASLSFTSSEMGSTFSCSLDGAPFTACSSPAALTGLAQGMHTFAVRATDVAGHDDPSPATRSWTVDTVAPDIAISAGPGNAATSGPRVVFGFTVSDGAVACSVDGAPFAACASPFAITPNLPAGPHQFAVRATDAAGNATTMTRSWTVVCAPPDATGAAALLHLDDAGQTLANAVAGGAPATLGDTTAVEPGDPSALPGARFGGGLAFTAVEGDHVAWPVALPAMPALTIELWARPAAPSGPRDLLVSSDGRVALQVSAVSPMLVQFSIAVSDGGPGGAIHTVSSAAVAQGAWHHVLVSLQAPTLRLWVDGARTEVAGVAPGPLALDAVRLGGAAATAYDGALDEVWLAQTAIASDDAALARYCPL